MGRARRRRRHAAALAAVRPAARAHEGATGARARRARLARHAGARRERVRSGRRRRRRARPQRLNGCKRDGFKVFIAAEGTGSADRIEQILVDEGVVVDRITEIPDASAVLHGARHPHRRRAARPRRGAARRNSSRSSPKPTSPVAGACTAGARGARKGLDHYEGLTVGDFVVHRVHGVGRYHGMETKEMFGVTRDRLVVEFKGGDRVYVDSEDIGLIRKYTGGEEPKLSKMGGADWDKTRARCARRCATSRASSSCCTAAGSRRRATCSGRHAVPAPDRGGVPLRGDARPGARRSSRPRPTWNGRSRWTASSAATSATARPRSRCAPRRRRCSTASRSRSSCRPRCSRASTARRSASGSRTIRCASRCSRGSSPRRNRPKS